MYIVISKLMEYSIILFSNVTQTKIVLSQILKSLSTKSFRMWQFSYPLTLCRWCDVSAVKMLGFSAGKPTAQVQDPEHHVTVKLPSSLHSCPPSSSKAFEWE